MLAVAVVVALFVLFFIGIELAAVVGHLGRIADSLAAQNAHYGVPQGPGECVPPEGVPAEPTSSNSDRRSNDG